MTLEQIVEALCALPCPGEGRHAFLVDEVDGRPVVRWMAHDHVHRV